MSEEVEPERLAQAAALRARMSSPGSDSSTQLEEWLQQDPRNTHAWNKVQAVWRLVGEQATSPPILRLRRAALTHAHERQDSLRTGWPGWRMVRSRPFAVTALAAVAAVILGALLTWQNNRFEVYRTHPGERRVITLSDGSQVALDSQSEVKVRYGAHYRELALLQGQARFDVAHDPSRPFSVAAHGQEVVATGTAFNVDILGPELLVTLLEGHVVVVPETPPEPLFATTVRTEGSASGSATSAHITLDAGEQLVISPSAAPRITRIRTDRTTAWEAGELVFDNEPLSTVVARVARYGGHPILISDDQTAELRVSGVFHAGDVDGFVSTVVSYLPVDARRDRHGAIHLSRHSSVDSPNP